MEVGTLADQEPFTAWLRRGISRDRIFAAPMLYEPTGTTDAVREQSQKRFGRSYSVINQSIDRA